MRSWKAMAKLYSPASMAFETPGLQNNGVELERSVDPDCSQNDAIT